MGDVFRFRALAAALRRAQDGGHPPPRLRLTSVASAKEVGTELVEGAAGGIGAHPPTRALTPPACVVCLCRGGGGAAGGEAGKARRRNRLLSPEYPGDSRARGSEVILSGTEKSWKVTMKNPLCLMCALSIAGFAFASAGSPEMEALVGRTKSLKLEERIQAVDCLLSLREAVSVELANIVSQANDGTLDSGAKAIALYLMGELGLLQCRQILVAEKDWKREPKDFHEVLWLNCNRRRGRNLIGFPARGALGRAGFGSSVARLVQQRPVADLSKYPTLHTALEVIGRSGIPGGASTQHDDAASLATCWCSRLRAKRGRAEGAVLQWYMFVCDSMADVLKPSAAYPNETRSTAAYLLGEFRTLGPTMLLWNVDMDDESGTCDRYAETIKVDTTTPQKPCVVALLKVGRRVSVYQGLTRIAAKDITRNSNRTLLMRTLLVIDPQRTRETYQSMVVARKDPQRWSGDDRKRSEQLQHLISVEDVLDLVPSPKAPADLELEAVSEAAKDTPTVPPTGLSSAGEGSPAAAPRAAQLSEDSSWAYWMLGLAAGLAIGAAITWLLLRKRSDG